MTKLNRRTIVLTGLAGVATPWVARAAEPEFKIKFGNIVSPDHPLNTSMAKVRDRVARETDGKVSIELFPKNQLGSDADMLSQLRSGALELFAQTPVLLSTLVPVASISGIGFAFPTYEKVWEAMDGPLGHHVRGAFEKANLVCLEKCWNHGFRQTTSSTKPIRVPEDFNGFKIRVPPSPLWTAMFKAFGAAPVSIPWAETYTAMQTRRSRTGSNSRSIGLLVDKMYEVQKYCSQTNHMWDGFWVLANRRFWDRLPPNLREIVERNINQEALAAAPRGRVHEREPSGRADVRRAWSSSRSRTRTFASGSSRPGSTQEWQKRYGDEAWALLEATTGKLGSILALRPAPVDPIASITITADTCERIP